MNFLSGMSIYTSTHQLNLLNKTCLMKKTNQKHLWKHLFVIDQQIDLLHWKLINVYYIRN